MSYSTHIFQNTLLQLLTNPSTTWLYLLLTGEVRLVMELTLCGESKEELLPIARACKAFAIDRRLDVLSSEQSNWKIIIEISNY